MQSVNRVIILKRKHYFVGEDIIFPHKIYGDIKIIMRQQYEISGFPKAKSYLKIFCLYLGKTMSSPTTLYHLKLYKHYGV